MLSNEKLAELKSKHGGDLHLLSAKGHEVVVRTPNDGEWGAFIDDREKRGARALKGLVLSVLVHPSEQEFQALLDKKPGLSNVFGAKVMEIAGIEEEAVAKKL